TRSDKFGNTPSGVSIEFLYNDLDLKADATISQFKSAMKEFYWFVTKYINMKENKKFDSKGIVTTFNKSMITNKLETVQLLAQSRISDQTYLENHPLINNAEDEFKRLEREEAERINRVDLDSIPAEDNTVDSDNG